MLCFKVYWQLIKGEDTPETSLTFMNLFMMKFKTVVLCLKLLTCLIVQSFGKKFSVKEFWASTHGSQGTAETVTWPCKSIILLTGHFKGPTKSNWTVWERLSASDQSKFDDKGWFCLKDIFTMPNLKI